MECEFWKISEKKDEDQMFNNKTKEDSTFKRK